MPDEDRTIDDMIDDPAYAHLGGEDCVDFFETSDATLTANGGEPDRHALGDAILTIFFAWYICAGFLRRRSPTPQQEEIRGTYARFILDLSILGYTNSLSRAAAEFEFRVRRTGGRRKQRAVREAFAAEFPEAALVLANTPPYVEGGYWFGR